MDNTKSVHEKGLATFRPCQSEEIEEKGVEKRMEVDDI